ncbi:uncharacterized protein A4U43_C03F12540 [Asparagus officinalis]|uniref:CASP-like protein n=1 Tax=Asparagus officinalis TaxID=4686 RepID=A0A5P1FAA0_ASPOF|nr:uncharacterized protein A4U43_C03F12540 [Asparagus officinalis]
MAQKSLAISILLLRILSLALLFVSLVILVTVTVKDADPDTGGNLTFKYFYTYRYVLSVDAIGGAYMLVQILFSVISLITGDYFGSKLHIWLHQFFDLVFALFFASGVGAGFWLTYDVKKQLGSAVALVPGLNKYFNLVYVSSGFLLAATLSTGAVILSSTYVLGRK